MKEQKFDKVVEWKEKENGFIFYNAITTLMFFALLIINASIELTYSRFTTSLIFFIAWIGLLALIFFLSHERKVYWRKI